MSEVRNQIATEMVREFKMSKDMAYQVTLFVLDNIHTITMREGKLRIGSHSFKVKERSARMGRNPKTGEPIQVNASRRVSYKNTSKKK